MITTTYKRGIEYSQYRIDEAAGAYFDGNIPEDFNGIFQEEMEKELPEMLIWYPSMSEILVSVEEMQSADKAWEEFDFDEAFSRAFDRAVDRCE